jgi:hypothetical protein
VSVCECVCVSVLRICVVISNGARSKQGIAITHTHERIYTRSFHTHIYTRRGFGHCYAGATLGANVSCIIQDEVVGDPPRCPVLASGKCQIACMSHDDCVGVPTIDEFERPVIAQSYCRAPATRGGVGTVGHVCMCVTRM